TYGYRGAAVPGSSASPMEPAVGPTGGFQPSLPLVPTIGDDVYAVLNSGYTTGPAVRFRFPTARSWTRPLNGAFIGNAVHRFTREAGAPAMRTGVPLHEYRGPHRLTMMEQPSAGVPRPARHAS
ncbi:MAG: hypothetical protein ACRETL_00585, partial [Gammaproteobacteria bacterium]